MIKKLLPAALAVAAALTMPQAARAQAVPDERAAAREFAYAAYRLRVKIKAEEPAAHRRFAMLESRACRNALGPEDEFDIEGLPLRAQMGLGIVLAEIEVAAVYGLTGTLFPGFVAELDRVATADPALVAGREAWRSSARWLQHARPLPQDTCAQIRRWRLAGYPLDGIPALQPAPIHGLYLKMLRQPSLSNVKPDRSHVRAAARMVQLGVPAGQAERFAGDTLFRGMPTTIVGADGGGEEL